MKAVSKHHQQESETITNFSSNDDQGISYPQTSLFPS